jgi:lauroyl/myristoyl acyltransferase/predicted RND superfamily exporter protein
LVGLGVALAAFIMIFEFLPPLFPERNVAQSIAPRTQPVASNSKNPYAHEPVLPSSIRTFAAFASTLVVGLTTLGVLAFGLPKIDPTEDALRPRNSPAYGAMAQVQAELNQKRDPLWVIVSGQNERDVAKKLDEVQPILAQAASNHVIENFTLPAQLWPHADFQKENRALALELASERALLHEAAQTNGFAQNSLVLLDKVLDTWQVAANSTGVFWPTNPVSRWIFEKLTARSSTNAFALGLVNLPKGVSGSANSRLAELSVDLARENVFLSGWQLLGGAIFSRVKANMWKVLTPMVVLVMLSLWLAFRRPREIIFSLAVLFLSGLVLLAVMRVAHWSWNLLNLMAVPMVLGTGVDYSIFMQLALRRHNGDVRIAYLSVGRALLLCGGTAVAGFGSLALSVNAGMASLGEICAVGIGSNMLIAIFLLPSWWTARENRNRKCEAGIACQGTNDDSGNRNSPLPTKPSSLYRGEVWRVAMASARLLPARPCRGLAPWMADAYRVFARGRREVVLENLLPLLNNNSVSAQQETRQLFRNFGQKLVDLWQYEAGQPINKLFGESHGWEHFEQARAQKRGILLLTPHLGNWEFGGPALAQKGVSLQVVTLAEPGDGFTQLRQASRARWQIETVVIGEDPFAFIDIIRRLESGATIALLVDRPSAPTAEMVELFGRPFAVSMAPAELARSTGCVLLPVFIPHTANGYEPNVLAPIPYDRVALRDRTARKNLTQEIIRVFEPVICQYPDQWYHFVPIWPHGQNSGGNGL